MQTRTIIRDGWTFQPISHWDEAPRADRSIGDLDARIVWLEDDPCGTIGPHAQLSIVIDRDERSLQDGPRRVLGATHHTAEWTIEIPRLDTHWADDLIARALPLLRRCPAGCHSTTVQVDAELAVRPGGWIEIDHSGRTVGMGILAEPIRCSADNTTSALACLRSHVALMPDGTTLDIAGRTP